jgi:Ca-activated chloride channel family protein
VAASALEKMAAELHDSDVCCLVGFATRAGTLHDGRRRLRRQSLQDVLHRIQEDPASPGLGDDTRMQEATRIAATMLKGDPSARRVRRLIVITDGIIQDDVDTLRELEEIRNEKIGVTTIGVGQEFNEEFLTRVADWTGGTYHYARTAEEIEKRLAEDFGVFQSIAGTDLTVSARGLEGAVVTAVTQLTPQTRMFEEVRLRDDWYQVEVGDVYGGTGLGLMSEFSLPWLSTGKHTVGEIQLEWRDPETRATTKGGHLVHVDCLAPNSPGPAVDPEVEGMFFRLQVYRAERHAQWAQESGRPGAATVRLREASTILRHLGEPELAERFEQQAADIEAEHPDSDRTKTLKDWVRRLAQRKEEERE